MPDCINNALYIGPLHLIAEAGESPILIAKKGGVETYVVKLKRHSLYRVTLYRNKTYIGRADFYKLENAVKKGLIWATEDN